MTVEKTRKAKKSYSHKKAVSDSTQSEFTKTYNPGSVRKLSAGPFQMIYNDDEMTAADFNEGILPEVRMYNCKHYECCLNVVAALDWEGFTCSGCNGEQNQQLIWRAQGECNKDQVLQTICKLPDFRQRKIESEEPHHSEFHGLRLVVNNIQKNSDE